MPWGVLLDRHGESQNGTSATLKNLDGSNATTWSAITGGSSSTSSLTADSNGNLPRFVEGGQYTLDVPALGVSGRRVEAVSGSVESDVEIIKEAPLNIEHPEYASLVTDPNDWTPALNAAMAAVDGTNGTILIPPRSTPRKVATPLTAFEKITLMGYGRDSGSELQFTSATPGARMFDLTGMRAVKMKGLALTLAATAPDATLLYLSGCFRCGFSDFLLSGQHTAAATTTYRESTGIALRGNSGDNRFTDFDINNLGRGIRTSTIQNYFSQFTLGSNYIHVHGDQGSFAAGISMTNGTMVGSATTTTRQILCEVSANEWWLVNVDCEGADVGWEFGKTGVGGPAALRATNCKVAATNKCIDIIYAQQTKLDSVSFAADSGATPEALTINSTDARDGTAIELLLKSGVLVGGATVFEFPLDGTIFPDRWKVIGRAKENGLPERWGNLALKGIQTIDPQADADVPFTVNGRSGTSVDLLQIKRGATVYFNADKFGSFFATQAGLSAKTSVKMTAVDGSAFIEQGEQSTDAAAPAANFVRVYPKDLSGKTMLYRRDSSRVELLPGALQGTATWDPASLANGASERKSVTVTGAAVGDPATAGLTTIAATGWDIQAAVIAADTVEVKITNNTGGVVDLGSGTVRAVVAKFS